MSKTVSISWFECKTPGCGCFTFVAVCCSAEPGSGQKAKWLRGSGDCIDFYWLVCAERDDDPPVLRLLRLNQKPPTARVTASKCTLQGKHTLLISTQVTNAFCGVFCAAMCRIARVCPPPPSYKKNMSAHPHHACCVCVHYIQNLPRPKGGERRIKIWVWVTELRRGKKSLGKTNK